MLTDAELELLDRLEREATPGPWEVEKRSKDDLDALIYFGGFPNSGRGAWLALRAGDDRLMCAARNSLRTLIWEIRSARGRYAALRELYDGQQCVLSQVREQLARAHEMVSDVDEWVIDAKDALDISNTSPAALEDELRRLESEHGVVKEIGNMTAAYEMFLERQEAEDEAAGKVAVFAPTAKPRTCHSCTSAAETYYCDRCRNTRNAHRRRRRAERRGAVHLGTGER